MDQSPLIRVAIYILVNLKLGRCTEGGLKIRTLDICISLMKKIPETNLLPVSCCSMEHRTISNSMVIPIAQTCAPLFWVKSVPAAADTHEVTLYSVWSVFTSEQPSGSFAESSVLVNN